MTDSTSPKPEGTPEEGGAKPNPPEAKPAGDKPAAAPGAEKPAAPAAKPGAPDAKPGAPAAKPAAKAAAKPKVEKKPLVDNGDGTVTDPNSGLMWKQTEAWLDTHKFYTWQTHQEYVDKINAEKFAGYDDWRIPTKAEAATLVDKTKKNMDKNGTEFPLDPIFAEGGAATTWISECTEEKVMRFDYKIGSEFSYPPAEIWSSIRLCRKPEGAAEEAKDDSKEAAAQPAAKPDAAAAKPEAKPAAPEGGTPDAPPPAA